MDSNSGSNPNGTKPVKRPLTANSMQLVEGIGMQPVGRTGMQPVGRTGKKVARECEERRPIAAFSANPGIGRPEPVNGATASGHASFPDGGGSHITRGGR